VKSIGANATYRYCGVVNSALSVTVLAFFFLGYALPLAVISALYILIACHVRRHRRRVVGPPRRGGSSAGNGHRNARTLKLVVIVVVVFGISWLPIHIQSLAGYFGFHSPEGAVYEVFRVVWNCMAYSNSCANPFIYHCRPSTGPGGGTTARRQRQYPEGTCRVLPHCCQQVSSFTSNVGRDGALPGSLRTKTTYVRATKSFRRTTYRT